MGGRSFDWVDSRWNKGIRLSVEEGGYSLGGELRILLCTVERGKPF